MIEGMKLKDFGGGFQEGFEPLALLDETRGFGGKKWRERDR